MSKIAIIGAGNMGKGLAKRLAGKLDLSLASRNMSAATGFASTISSGPAPRMDVREIAAAIRDAEVVILALPFDAALEVASSHDLVGKVVVDITNPVKPDYSGLSIGHTTSAAEQIQAAARGARVVKAYNTVFAQLFDLPAAQTTKVPVFLAGNDEAAVSQVANIVSLSGFSPETTGGLDAARLLEPVGMLNIRFGYGLGRGTAIAPTWTALAA